MGDTGGGADGPRYTLSYKRSAEKAVAKIPQKKARGRVEDAIEGLAVEPQPPGSTQLSGKHSMYRRIDVSGVGSEYRVIYQVLDDELAVVVVIVGQREGVYDILKRLG
ncbi:MAG: type II toxin-antitoxin system RelE/ParE family toxin [Rubrobacter sp.]|nr:type II toxin-antitoxin system RelE/ParE family toxin [Rubrobacter sp.]